MKHLTTSLAAAALLLGPAVLPALASSTATSSASDSIAASVGSLSDSVQGSSNSSSRATGVAEGEYRLIEVAAAENRPGQVQMHLQPVGNTAADAGITLRLPQQAFDASGLAPEHTVTVRQRAYGVEFANSQTQQAFFLALNDAWLQELRNNPVSL